MAEMAPSQARGRRFSELAVGDELWDALTVTEAHVVMAAGIFNDPGPNHVNALQAAGGRFGERIAHGPLLIGIAAGILGNALGASIIALLEQSARFSRPTRLGETVIGCWAVSALDSKPRFDDGGIVCFEGKLFDGSAETLVEMTMVLAVADRPLWDPAAHIRNHQDDHSADITDHKTKEQTG